MNSKFVRACVAGLFALGMATLSYAQEAKHEVDLLLTLAADASLSVDQSSHQLQREGYARAFTDSRLLSAIRAGPSGRIGICFFEWASTDMQNIVIDWTLIDGTQTAKQLSERLLAMPRTALGLTSIGGAIDFAVAQFGRAPFSARRRIIDISGDGINNGGRNPRLARDEAIERGITINALVILNGPQLAGNPEHQNPPGGLTDYYRTNVIGGPGAFVAEADDFESFGRAIVRKLIAEIAEASPQTKRLVDVGSDGSLGHDVD